MQGVVPAAGEGTRLRPHTADRPKGLVRVAGRPLLAHCFDALVGLGVAELVVVVGYRGEAIVEHFGDAYRDVPVTYARQERRQGLAHALLQAAPHVDGDFVHCNGDNVFVEASLGRVVERHREAGADATLLVERIPRERARTTGVCVTDDEGRVVDLVEKPDDPPSTLALAGLFAFSPAVFDACRAIEPSERGEYELPDAVRRLLPGGRVETVHLDGWRRNVNDEADVRAVERRLED